MADCQPLLIFNMPDIWQIVLGGLTITMKQNVWLQGGMCPEKFQLG